jgi:putative membrane protein
VKEFVMMGYWDSGFGGMHLLWWFFWILAIAIFFSMAVPVRRGRYSQLRETPLDVLRRRFAAGELTTAEFDERSERLIGSGPDARQTQRPGTPGPGQPTATH